MNSARLLFLVWNLSLLGQVQTAWRPAILSSVGIEQKMGAQVPLDLPFSDETGQRVTIRQYTGKPIILALVYYQCPSLCNMVLNGLLRSVKTLSLQAGQDFEIVTLSFDPRETAQMAVAKKASYLRGYDRPGAEQGWHFLTGAERSTKVLADTVGFHYAYDNLTNQYAHSSAILVLTPDGRVAKYFYGIEYPVRDLRLGLIEAAGRRIGSPIDQVLLFCYHYNPANGRYGLVVMNVLRIGGLFTLGALSTFIFISLWRRDLRQQGMT
ncbi:SCO family protein [Bryobacter aggregatus]|uniref:SCO family protein n=1 Tax=Bryobacter aggregatus TaxID=360054 RepID=UPI0004E0C47C|nr:SCO family protein [Bryobacter aggregatus]